MIHRQRFKINMAEINNMQKRGYFFTLDAFVAMGIIVVGLVIVLAAYSYRPVTVQGSVISSDLTLSLSNTKVSDVNNDYVRNLINNGTITNSDNSLLQQTGEFYVNNQMSMGSYFLQNVTSNLVPRQYGVNITINEQEMFSRGRLLNSSRFVISSRSIVFGIYNGSMWGPLPAEVRVWQ